MLADIVIVGGGVAGLWTLNRLRQQGYQAILLEKNALGAGQTIASQGIIHGGIKYALSGEISASSQHISDMPRVWNTCLRNQGDIDLSDVAVLSEHYYLCSQQKITQKITQFFAQKALRSDSEALACSAYPGFFQNNSFSGLLTQVHECVLDVPSLVRSLSKSMMPYIVKVDDVALQKNDNQYSVKAKNADEEITLSARQIILTAGEGNADLFSAQKMQKRPLQMVILKADNLPRIFVHCVQLSTNPVLTVTSHDCNDKPIWYLGGQLAEDGAHMDKDALIAKAAQLVKQQFPWFAPINPQWHTLFINRAEGFNHGKRPESITVNTHDNLIMAWPTKLTFAPLLADKILSLLQSPTHDNENVALDAWPKPEIAHTPWEHLC